LLAAKEEGFSDVVYLDARTDTYLEELSAANIFVVKARRCLSPADCRVLELRMTLCVSWHLEFEHCIMCDGES
jgi:hypothetical protein